MRAPEPASGPLDVTNRAELEHFLRSLVGGRLPASVDRKLVDVLATTAVRTVPTLHALFGNGKPPAPRVCGLALEGMSAEDREYGGRRRRRRRFDDDEYEGGGYGQYGESQYEEENGYGEAEFDEAEEEERFLPLIPLAGKVLGGLLGRLMKEGESEFDEAEEEGEEGEAEEEFLDKIFKRVLGQPTEQITARRGKALAPKDVSP